MSSILGNWESLGGVGGGGGISCYIIEYRHSARPGLCLHDNEKTMQNHGPVALCLIPTELALNGRRIILLPVKFCCKGCHRSKTLHEEGGSRLSDLGVSLFRAASGSPEDHPVDTGVAPKVPCTPPYITCSIYFFIPASARASTEARLGCFSWSHEVSMQCPVLSPVSLQVLVHAQPSCT